MKRKTTRFKGIGGLLDALERQKIDLEKLNLVVTRGFLDFVNDGVCLGRRTGSDKAFF